MNSKILKPIFLLPLTFTLVFGILLAISLIRGEDALIGLAFLFGFLTLPTSFLVDTLFVRLMGNELPFSVQLAEVYISGLINMIVIGLLVEIAYRIYKKNNAAEENDSLL